MTWHSSDWGKNRDNLQNERKTENLPRRNNDRRFVYICKHKEVNLDLVFLTCLYCLRTFGEIAIT